MIISFLWILGAIALSADSFREGTAQRLLSDVRCTGGESSIIDCQYSLFQGFSCTTSGIICQGL